MKIEENVTHRRDEGIHKSLVQSYNRCALNPFKGQYMKLHEYQSNKYLPSMDSDPQGTGSGYRIRGEAIAEELVAACY